MEKEEAPGDLLGVVVSYSVNVKLMLACMGGELEVDLPFKLVHPRPGKEVAQSHKYGHPLILAISLQF